MDGTPQQAQSKKHMAIIAIVVAVVVAIIIIIVVVMRNGSSTPTPTPTPTPVPVPSPFGGATVSLKESTPYCITNGCFGGSPAMAAGWGAVATLSLTPSGMQAGSTLTPLPPNAGLAITSANAYMAMFYLDIFQAGHIPPTDTTGDNEVCNARIYISTPTGKIYLQWSSIPNGFVLIPAPEILVTASANLTPQTVQITKSGGSWLISNPNVTPAVPNTIAGISMSVAIASKFSGADIACDSTASTAPGCQWFAFLTPPASV